MEFLKDIYFGNTVQDYLWVVGSLLFGVILVRFIAHRISNTLFRVIAGKTQGVNKNELYNLLEKPLKWLIMLIILYVCTSHLDYPQEWNLAPKEEFGLRMFLHRSFIAFLIIVITWAALKIIKFLGIILMAKAELTESKSDDQIIPFLMEIIKVVAVTLGTFIFMGSVFKVDVGALIAGLGIGGLALALAAKESLENLLASFVIFFDKPFVIGDLVTVNGVTGSIEKIGFRSTRIRTLEKSYLTLPNRLMIDNVLDNLSLRTFRRVSFKIGVLYGTSEEQLKQIVEEIQNFIDNHPHTNQDGEIHFIEFGASSLDIMVLYYIDTMDWSVFLKIKEEINFEIMRIVQAHGADFAFPTQTIHLEKDK
ncbi:mechanosensitive ion channel family protein [Salibacteraceae bacterium]|nr:mechanosensitive ion channel family protein [Salibacteraceae bacterium]MDC1303840.1 mechanosensitive ion channel family protein [Salibacteraceae bacterium]